MLGPLLRTLKSVAKLESSGLNENRKFSIMNPSCEAFHLSEIVYEMLPSHLKYQTMICTGSRFCVNSMHCCSLCALDGYRTQDLVVAMNSLCFSDFEVFSTMMVLKQKGSL